jgi:hypothetical protein
MEEIKPKPKRGRPRKPENFHTSILSAEQVLAIKGTSEVAKETDEMAAARRAKDAARKKVERDHARAEKEFEGIETKEALWAHNRAQLPESELTALLEKQEKVRDLVYWVNDVLAGTNLPPEDPDYVSLEEGSQDLFEFAKTHGRVAMEIVLLGQYWKEPIYTEKFQGSDPTSIFARTGLVTAMPSHKLFQLEQFLARHRAVTVPASPLATGNGWIVMKCACNSIEGQKSVSLSIAKAYEQQGRKFLCWRCKDVEAKSRAQSTLYRSPQ